MALLWVWGIITAIALVFEFLTSYLISIWFASGGLITLLVVALAPNLNFIWQILIFAGISVVLLLSLRKICLKLLNNNNATENK